MKRGRLAYYHYFKNMISDYSERNLRIMYTLYVPVLCTVCFYVSGCAYVFTVKCKFKA